MSLLSVLINNNSKYISDKELVSKYIRNLCNSKGKIKNNLIKKWAGQTEDIFPNKTYTWPTNTCKGAQHHRLIKTIMRYHLTPVRMAIIKKRKGNKS